MRIVRVEESKKKALVWNSTISKYLSRVIYRHFVVMRVMRVEESKKKASV